MDNGHASRLAEPSIQAHLWHIEAVEKQSEDLMVQLGCFEGNFDFGCASLLAKSLVLKIKVLYTRYELMVLEEAADAKAKADKELKTTEAAAELGSTEL